MKWNVNQGRMSLGRQSILWCAKSPFPSAVHKASVRDKGLGDPTEKESLPPYDCGSVHSN